MLKIVHPNFSLIVLERIEDIGYLMGIIMIDFKVVFQGDFSFKCFGFDGFDS